MSLESLVHVVLEFIAAHPYLTGGILAVIGLLTFVKFKVVLKAVAACVVIGAIGYVILFVVNLASTGIENTAKLKGQPSQPIDQRR